MKKIGKKEILIYSFLLLILPIYFVCELIQDNKDQKNLQQHGVRTECIAIAYSEGKSGVRGPKKGYYNKCQYNIADSVHYCYIFTSVKPLPFGTKISLLYYQKKDGTVFIDFPDSNRFLEYGFNDYGY